MRAGRQSNILQDIPAELLDEEQVVSETALSQAPDIVPEAPTPRYGNCWVHKQHPTSTTNGTHLGPYSIIVLCCRTEGEVPTLVEFLLVQNRISFV